MSWQHWGGFGLHFGSMFAPCWLHVASMLAPCCPASGASGPGAPPGRQSQRKKLSFMLAGLRFAKTRLAKNMVRAHGCARRQSENAFFSKKSYYDCEKTWSAHIDVQNPQRVCTFFPKQANRVGVSDGGSIKAWSVCSF